MYADYPLLPSLVLVGFHEKVGKGMFPLRNTRQVLAGFGFFFGAFCDIGGFVTIGVTNLEMASHEYVFIFKY
jgi:hypothetical protein